MWGCVEKTPLECGVPRLSCPTPPQTFGISGGLINHKCGALAESWFPTVCFAGLDNSDPVSAAACSLSRRPLLPRWEASICTALWRLTWSCGDICGVSVETIRRLVGAPPLTKASRLRGFRNEIARIHSVFNSCSVWFVINTWLRALYVSVFHTRAPKSNILVPVMRRYDDGSFVLESLPYNPRLLTI